jgi:hypothetical protein
MFDGDPRVSCATLEITDHNIVVQHFRVAYNISEVVSKIRQDNLPAIYAAMFLNGKKMN